MKLFVDRLTTSPTPQEFEGSASWWEERSGSAGGADETPYEIIRPFQFAFEAHLMGEDIRLEGTMEGEIEIECSRCVSRYRHPLRDRFSLVLEPARSRVPADPESAEALTRDGICLGDEIESGWFRGSEIRLDAYFAELVALGMPVQPVCRDDCKGLCPSCGADRNAGDCGCAVAEDGLKAESPFAVLAALKDGKQGD